MTKINETLIKLETILREEVLCQRTLYMVISNAYQYVYINNLIYYKDNELLKIASEVNEHLSS